MIKHLVYIDKVFSLPRGENNIGDAQFVLSIEDVDASAVIEDGADKGIYFVITDNAKGIESIDAAEQLRGRILYLNRNDARLPKGRYFVADLLGMRVTDVDSGKYYGKLTDVMQTGANDVYEITDDGGIVYLMPAVKSMVIDVNIETGEMKIRPIAGIFDDAD